MEPTTSSVSDISPITNAVSMLNLSTTADEESQSRFGLETLGNEVDTSLNSTLHDVVQNFVLIWLDSSIDEPDENYKHFIIQLRRIVNTIDTFTEPEKCIRYLEKIKYESVFMIVSGALGHLIVPDIHKLFHLDSVYIFCQNKLKHEEWAKDWSKVKGVFTQISEICTALKQNTQQCDHDSISVTITSGDVNCLEPSFMYTQLLKETLIEMPHDDDKAKKELADFCRQKYKENADALEIIDEFEEDYNKNSAIRWYTRASFVYQMLNRALRTQEVETIIKMGFLLHDIHHQIVKKQSTISSERFTVYRGQRMSNTDLQKMKNKKGCLLAFNNFLSTSREEKVALEFAR
jgi:hypothetical protein